MVAINPTATLHYEKYFSLWHKHHAPGNRVVKKRWVPIRQFSRELRVKIWAEKLQ
jgi:hypothetical protein